MLDPVMTTIAQKPSVTLSRKHWFSVFKPNVLGALSLALFCISVTYNALILSILSHITFSTLSSLIPSPQLGEVAKNKDVRGSSVGGYDVATGASRLLASSSATLGGSIVTGYYVPVSAVLTAVAISLIIFIGSKYLFTKLKKFIETV